MRLNFPEAPQRPKPGNDATAYVIRGILVLFLLAAVAVAVLLFVPWR